jgi:branched-chain amino acid transport system ATP-binding protein
VLLEVRDLTAGYGKVAVLHGVSLGVDDGECVALLGPNNAGKSTLLRVISGLIAARAGRLAFDGHDITADTPTRRVARGIVHVPEGRHVFPDLSVEENLIVGGLRLARGTRRRRLAEIYDILSPLHGIRAQLAGTLSGGQQQMLVIARGLMAEPRILILDEPSLGLSPLAIDRVMEVLRQIRERGTTMLLVEQSVQFCFDLCSRGYVLRNGRVVIAESIQRLSTEALQQAYFA